MFVTNVRKPYSNPVRLSTVVIQGGQTLNLENLEDLFHGYLLKLVQSEERPNLVESLEKKNVNLGTQASLFTELILTNIHEINLSKETICEFSDQILS